MEVITQTIGKSSQKVIYSEVIRVEGHKLKVSIASDPYKFQCWAKVSRWDGEKWHLVHSITSGNMVTETGMYIQRQPYRPIQFRADRNELLRVAFAVLDIEEAAA